MAHHPRYQKDHPGLYRPRMPIFWWVYRWAHVRFIMRELTSVFVAYYALLLLCFVRALAAGPEAYAALTDWLRTPLALVLHAFTFLMVLFHSVTWFNLAPKAMVVRIGKRPVPGGLIAGLNYAAWLVCSAILAWIILAT